MISFLNRAEPVTLVRSPILTKVPAGRTVMSGGNHHWLDTRESRPGRRRGDLAGRISGDGPGNRRNMLGRGPAAAADDVDDALLAPLADLCRSGFRPFVIFAEIVGQAGIGIG